MTTYSYYLSKEEIENNFPLFLKAISKSNIDIERVTNTNISLFENFLTENNISVLLLKNNEFYTKHFELTGNKRNCFIIKNGKMLCKSCKIRFRSHCMGGWDDNFAFECFFSEVKKSLIKFNS